MNPSAKTVGQIASIFGVIFVIFAAFAALVNYVGITAQGGFITAGLLEFYLLNAMLPFLLLAVLSFAVAGVIARTSRDSSPEEVKPTEAPAEPAPQPEQSPIP